MSSNNNDELETEISNWIRKTLRFPPALWEQLENKAKEELMDENMSAFIRKILRLYLGSGFQTHIENTRVKELLDERDNLLNEDRELLQNVKDLLIKAQSEPKPDGFANKEQMILNYLSHHRSKVKEIAQRTGIPKNEVIIVIADLVKDGIIGLDPNWKYYKLESD
jgi:uncharacterized membrane protein